MTTTPKVSIVIPVYNTEKYLVECLDSIINQTVRDIQIICVNDGSTDRSLDILYEYAGRDPRIMVIDKLNGGPTSARYAAYAYLCGKYTLFVDSDDWIDTDLCEKAYCKAEESNAPMTMFFFCREGTMFSNLPWLHISGSNKYTVEEKKTLLDNPGQFLLWRTDFLHNNNIHLNEAQGILAGEDLLPHWKAVVLADHIAMLPDCLYHYRCNTTSVTSNGGKRNFEIIQIFVHIHRFLNENNYYSLYKDQYLEKKLKNFFCYYGMTFKKFRREFRKLIHDDLTTDDREYYRTAPEDILSNGMKQFYEMIDAGPVAQMKYHILREIRRILKKPEQIVRRWIVKPLKRLSLKKMNRTVMRPLENLWRRIRSKPLKTTRSEKTESDISMETPAGRQIRELSELDCQLSKEDAEIRNQSCHDSKSNRVA